MPTLFISYKRNSTVVAPLRTTLKDAHYRLWIDINEIHLGDPDWQARIDLGLSRCDGVLLCITPEACTSEPIKYEIRKAIEFGKPIFAVILEQGVSRSEAITKLGLPPKLQVENFTDVAQWEANIGRLLEALRVQGLRVSPHDLRRERDPNNPRYILHQMYLRKLIGEIENVSLADIVEEQTRAVGLEEVYVDSPTYLSLSVEVQNWHVADWWLTRTDQTAHDGPYMRGRSDMPEQNRLRPEALGYERAPFEVLVGQVEAEIENYRAANPNAKPDEKRVWDNLWTNGVKEGVRHLHLTNLTAARSRLVILGKPGSGKSTYVRHLGLSLAKAGLNSAVSLDPTWTHGARTPVYIELRRFVASDYFPKLLTTTPTAADVWHYIRHELGDELHAYADDLRYDLEHGHALLILDGLDEVGYPEGELKQRQDQLIGLAKSLDSRYEKSRIIVTSRPYAYEGWTLPGFVDERIAPFADSHPRELAERLYRAVNIADAAAKAERLVEQLAVIDDELKDRPLFVTLMATLYLRGAEMGLPTGRSALYRESIRLLLERWTTSKAGVPTLTEILGDNSPADLYRRLSELAYAVHSESGAKPGSAEIDYGQLSKHLRPLGRHVAADLIGYLSENAGVLVSPCHKEESEIFQFAHRTFQEYLAAEQLVRLCNDAQGFTLIRDSITAKPDVWRVPTLFVGDILSERGGDMWQLVEDVLGDLAPEDKLAADDRQWWAVWLAAGIVSEQGLDSQRVRRKSERQIRDSLRDMLVRLLETAQALPPMERAECGRALGNLGDPRKGVGTRKERINEQEVELPDIVWCAVPPPPNGTVILGADNRSNNPRREHTIDAAFQIAKYPITNRQYQTFAESGDYANDDWWQGFPKKYAPQELDTPRYGWPNHPCNEVSWYQAVAFTRWLTAQYRAAGLLDDGLEIRLPTEWEWEYAARGTDERMYPYGNTFDPAKANTAETGIGTPTAVGSFPDGEAWCGALDMSGNVWQWCENKYSKDNERRVLRGGSFDYFSNYAACACRHDDYPHLVSNLIGFRVVVAGPSVSSDL